jgi:hypothetical protein
VERGVWRGDLWGKRLEKYKAVAEATLRQVGLSKLEPAGRDLLFLVQDSGEANSYAAGWPLNKIFPENGVGIVTAHDAFSTGFTRVELGARFESFRRAAGNAAELHREFKVAEKAGWNILKGWQALADNEHSTASYIRPIVYTPFDTRLIFY